MTDATNQNKHELIELDLPVDELFNEVHRSNMSKLVPCDACGRTGVIAGGDHAGTTEWLQCGDCGGKGGHVLLRDDGKVEKTVGWQPADITSIIWKEMNESADPPRPLA